MVKSNSLFTYLVTTLLFSFFLTNLPAQNVGIDLTNPLQKLDVDGAIRIGTTPDSIDGSIRYLSGDFQGYDGIKWRSFIQQISIDGDTIYLEDGGSVVLPPGNISSYIEDNDSDTRVHTEESPDEDIIRFDAVSYTHLTLPTSVIV